LKATLITLCFIIQICIGLTSDFNRWN